MENYRDELLKKDLNPWYFLALLSSIEVIIVLIALIRYLGKTRAILEVCNELSSLLFQH